MNIILFTAKLLKEHTSYAEKRAQLIGRSNAILRSAKKTIFALHRGDTETASIVIGKNILAIEEVRALIGDDIFLYAERGAFAVAIEEFYESVFFYEYVTGDDKSDLFDRFTDIVFYEIYLGALCDYTGELVRYAVRKAQMNTYAEVDVIRAHVDEIVGVLLDFDMTGKLRVKLEDVKRNLKKLESIVYDLRIRQ